MKVLVVDDSSLYRRILARGLAKFPAVASVETARDGRSCLAKVDVFRPDLITLDVEMPGLSGIEVLERLRQQGNPAQVVLVTALSRTQIERAVGATDLGVFGFIAKPGADTPEQNEAILHAELIQVISALQFKLEVGRVLYDVSAPSVVSAAAAPVPVRLVAIGVSTGGPLALTSIVPKLPADLRFPIVIVQHMPELFTTVLAETLAAKSVVRVTEAVEGAVLEPGRVYLAPGGCQTEVRKAPGGRVFFRVTDEPAVNFCKPSVDIFFKSATEAYGDAVVAVLMTGMGSDGVEGMRLLKNSGARTWVQDEASCTVFGMPMQALRAGVVDAIVPLDRIPETIARLKG